MNDMPVEPNEEERRVLNMSLAAEIRTLAHEITERDLHLYNAMHRVIAEEDVHEVFKDYALRTSSLLYALEGKILSLCSGLGMAWLGNTEDGQ